MRSTSKEMIIVVTCGYFVCSDSNKLSWRQELSQTSWQQKWQHRVHKNDFVSDVDIMFKSPNSTFDLEIKDQICPHWCPYSVSRCKGSTSPNLEPLSSIHLLVWCAQTNKQWHIFLLLCQVIEIKFYYYYSFLSDIYFNKRNNTWTDCLHVSCIVYVLAICHLIAFKCYFWHMKGVALYNKTIYSKVLCTVMAYMLSQNLS